MRKSPLLIGLMVLCAPVFSQVENHLTNNNATTSTFFRATNQNSQNGGIRLGINGGNTNGNVGFIDLRENRHLRFSTNATERARFLNTGEFGLGLTNPITLLDVNGQATIRVLPEDSTLTRIVVADSVGTLFYRNLSSFGGGSGTDNDWLVTGNDMQAIPTGNVSVGIAPNSAIKFFTSDNNTSAQIAGAFNKISAPGQIGTPIGVRGLASAMPGRGIAVQGIAQSSETGATAVGIEGIAQGSNLASTGVRGTTSGTSSNLSIGVQAVGAAATPVQYGVQTTAGIASLDNGFNAGIRSVAFGNNVNATSSNFGLHCAAHPGTATTTNVGVFARAIRPPSNVPGNPNINYGIWALVDADGVVNRAAYLDGDVDITGTLNNPSDKKLKNGVEEMNGAIDLLGKLIPKTYTYKQDIPYLNLPNGKQYGFIAQELEEVMPELVSHSVRPEVRAEDGKRLLAEAFEYKSVSYTGLIPVLVQAVKELDAENKALRTEVENLRYRDDIEDVSKGSLGIEANLYQNNPNPFSEETVIRYDLPNNFQRAHLYVYNMNGEQLKQYELRGAGNGSLTIFGHEYQAGMYLYALIVDGKEIDTKRMILTN